MRAARFERLLGEADAEGIAALYDDYYDAAKKDGEPVIAGQYVGSILRYADGELIRIEPGREGSPVCHVVWDAYAQCECRTYPTGAA